MFGLQRVILGLLVSACWTSAAQTNVFVNPSPLTGTLLQAIANLQTYGAGQVLNVSWTTNYDSVDLVLWQAAVDGSSRNLVRAKTSGTSYLWTIDVGTFKTSGANTTSGVSNNVFNLVLYKTGTADGSQAFSSQYFNVSGTTGPFPSATTTYASQAPYYTTTSTATSSGGYGITDSSQAASNDAAMRLGLGLGLGLGIPLLLAVAALAYLLGRRRSRPESASPSAGMVASQPAHPSGFPTQQQQEQRPALTEHYGPGVTAGPNGQQQEHGPSLTEHYSPGGWNQEARASQIQPAPQQAQIPMQPIVTAKYQ